MRCRIRTPVVAAVVAAAALLWLRMRRRRVSRRDTLPSSASSTNDAATNGAPVTTRCPYAGAELGGYVRLPVYVQLPDLPDGVSVAPLLSYPPRHAMIPFVLQESIAGDEVFQVSQALLCCEDVTTCAEDGKHARFSSGPGVEMFRDYVATACPFLRRADGDDDEIVCAALSDPTAVFSHVAASRAFCVFLGHLPESSTIISCVLILSSQSTPSSTIEALLKSTRWMALASSVLITPSLVNAHPTSQAAASTCGGAFGKGRIRVVAKSLRSGRVVTAAVSPCPHIASLSIEMDEVIETDTPTLVITDGVDGEVRRVPLYAPEPNTPAGSPTRRGTDDAPALTDPSPSSQSQVSSSLEASAMEALGEGGSKPLLLYTNDVVGVSFACAAGSSVQEVRFSSRPSVVYTLPAAPGVSITASSPILSIERVCTLPEEWEQASATFSTEDFFELLHHNIIYCLTPWETLLQRPEITSTELSGYPTWAFHEDQEGMRCRTYVCLNLEKFGSSCGSRRLRGSADSVEPSRVVELLLLRWEAPSEDWDAQLPLLRSFVDRLHIDFNSAS
jgi:hypothetical protein